MIDLKQADNYAEKYIKELESKLEAVEGVLIECDEWLAYLEDTEHGKNVEEISKLRVKIDKHREGK